MPPVGAPRPAVTQLAELRRAAAVRMGTRLRHLQLHLLQLLLHLQVLKHLLLHLRLLLLHLLLQLPHLRLLCRAFGIGRVVPAELVAVWRSVQG